MVVKVVPGQEKDGGYMLPGKIHITRRELEVLAMIANGISIEETAKKFRTSQQTVKNHLFKLVKKMNANGSRVNSTTTQSSR